MKNNAQSPPETVEKQISNTLAESVEKPIEVTEVTEFVIHPVNETVVPMEL
jgi:hypothetical protein